MFLDLSLSTPTCSKCRSNKFRFANYYFFDYWTSGKDDHLDIFFLIHIIQILQNEFKSRKPHYEKLEEAASNILSSSGDTEPSSGKMVREKLNAISQKWQGLTGQLEQRDCLIDQAMIKTNEFQELLRGLSSTATELEEQLTNHHSSSTQPDAVKKQLEDVQNISAQLREERKKLKQAEAVNAELSALVTEDYLKADLVKQLESVSKPFKRLEDKAGS